MEQLAFEFGKPITFTQEEITFTHEEQMELARRILRHAPPAYVPGQGIPLFCFAPGCRITRRDYHNCAMAIFAAADRHFLKSVGIKPEANR